MRQAATRGSACEQRLELTMYSGICMRAGRGDVHGCICMLALNCTGTVPGTGMVCDYIHVTQVRKHFPFAI